MAGPVKLSGRWYWLACSACGWRGDRETRRLRKCPRCRAALHLLGRLDFRGEATVGAKEVRGGP